MAAATRGKVQTDLAGVRQYAGCVYDRRHGRAGEGFRVRLWAGLMFVALSTARQPEVGVAAASDFVSPFPFFFFFLRWGREQLVHLCNAVDFGRFREEVRCVRREDFFCVCLVVVVVKTKHFYWKSNFVVSIEHFQR